MTTSDETMALAMAGVRDAWNILAPVEKWRGHATGWTAPDLWTLGGLIYEAQPAAVVIAGGLEAPGLAVYVGDLLDLNKRGKVLAAQPMSREMRRVMPEHRRVQYLTSDLTVEVERAVEFCRAAAPVLLLANDPEVERSNLPSVVTLGGYMVTGLDPLIQQGFMPDPGRDPFGLSRRTWLMRVPV